MQDQLSSEWKGISYNNIISIIDIHLKNNNVDSALYQSVLNEIMPQLIKMQNQGDLYFKNVNGQLFIKTTLPNKDPNISDNYGSIITIGQLMDNSITCDLVSMGGTAPSFDITEVHSNVKLYRDGESITKETNEFSYDKEKQKDFNNRGKGHAEYSKTVYGLDGKARYFENASRDTNNQLLSNNAPNNMGMDATFGIGYLQKPRVAIKDSRELDETLVILNGKSKQKLGEEYAVVEMFDGVEKTYGIQRKSNGGFSNKISDYVIVPSNLYIGSQLFEVDEVELARVYEMVNNLGVDNEQPSSGLSH